MQFVRLIIFIGFISIIFQCNSNPEAPEVCTTEFVTFSVTVLNPNSEPADSVQVTVMNQGTRETYPVCEEASCRTAEPGDYVIMHDGLQEQISQKGENVLVKGTKGDLQFEEEFIFRAGECHVQKIAGPDTVSLSAK